MLRSRAQIGSITVVRSLVLHKGHLRKLRTLSESWEIKSIYRVYTNEWWGFVSGLVKQIFAVHCSLLLFDSPTQNVFMHGTVDFIRVKKFL
jgi:hypothetical protein